MRRSQAPSQLVKRVKRSDPTDHQPLPLRNIPRGVENKSKESSQRNDTQPGTPRPPLVGLSDHEALIRSILVKPFKVPISGYVAHHQDLWESAELLGKEHYGIRMLLEH